ncbi:N-acetyldiaminopimelate deacetylase [Desemzia sp. RIT804]|uniref:N-acetyldiaminopimelate deacetylase n=1 Tax=Desemzia sp. RIT 804 TaxID=2810209 RepID=UPI001951FEF2|nr:N-acetyldiaminopimelate deacetylase [Desemzia sp. RIT 804]MBM6613332.1 N-acetyldiaminopimelate deacetylase [Desemzia sp. RIT 804]
MNNLDPFIKIRRDLHLIPEIGLQEYKTHEYLLNVIRQLPSDHLEVKTDETAILVRIKGTEGKRTIGWRTDIDGLPVIEQTKLPFESIYEGRMHACGHDVHMSIALGILSYFSTHPAKDHLVFFFQPAEETVSGAKIYYDKGFLNEWMPDEFYGLHIDPNRPVGTIATKEGTLFASTCDVKVDFHGIGGHAAYPQEANDMIVAASQFVNQVQTIVSRNVNPIEGAVVTLGSFHAGTTGNVISDHARIEGTIRALTKDMSYMVQKRFKEIAKGIEITYQCKVDVELNMYGYLPVINSPKETIDFIEFMENREGVHFHEAETAMTGEDFGYLLDKVPGTMFWLGVDTPYGLHHPQMSPKEEAIPFAIEVVSDFLEQKGNHFI